MTALLLFLAVLTVPAAEPYFCVQAGRTLYYERYDASGTKLKRTTTLEIGQVRPDGSNGRTVEYGFTLRKPGGAPLYGGRAPMTAGIDADGSVRMDIGASLAAVLRNLFPRAEIVSRGATALLPARMQPGDELPEAHCTVEAAGAKYRIDVTERRVLRRERVTVPAGSFDALVVREHKVERGPGRHRDTVSDSWYVAGVGYVRHDTYDKNLRLDTTEVLKKY